MHRILLIEDEKHLARFIELELQNISCSVTVAFDGKSGLELAVREPWDAILLDLMLPGMDGLEVCRSIRASKRTPILMLTARDSLSDKVSGLDSGADDYIAKPFAIEELLARLRVVFRRQEEAAVRPGSVLRLRDLCVNTDARTVRKGSEFVELTKREYELLVALISNADRVMTREALLDQVWGFEAAVDTNVVDVYIRYLRNKLDGPDEAGYIQTQRGIGYVMRR